MSPKSHPTPQDRDAGYVRVSKVDAEDYTDRQTAIEELVSVRTKELREAAAKQGRAIPDELLFVDMDLSGTSVEKRPGMTGLVTAGKRGEFARLWVKNLSRLFRNLAEQTVYINQIEKAGVRIMTLQEPSEGEKPILDLTRNVLGAVNQYLADAVGQQIKANNRIVASMGRLAGGTPPLGYKYDKEAKQILPDQARKDDALKVFQLYIELGSFIGVAAALNAQGIPTRNGALWRHDKVKAILANPIYRGKVHFCGEVWPAKHDLIFPHGIIERVDAMLAMNEQLKAIAPSHTAKIRRTYSGLPMWSADESATERMAGYGLLLLVVLRKER